MSHLLKRTKKSCLKIFRKFSSSKQLFAKKTDDTCDDVTSNTDNNNCSSSNNNNNSIMKIETSPMPKEKVSDLIRKSEESLPSMTTAATYHQHESQTSPIRIGKQYPITIELDEESPNNTILHKLTARLFLTADGYDFHRLQHLRSDTGSEVAQFDVDTTDFIEDNVVFEKVRYKDDIRYFRHTPSNSSLDNYRPGSVATTPDYDCTHEIDCSLESDLHLDNEGNHKVNHQFTNFGFYAPKEINMSLGLKPNGNHQRVIISQDRDNNNKLMAVVKWDINGNSLDYDDDDLLPHEYLEDFDKRLAALQQLQTTNDNDNDNESGDSSLRSSSTTLETWVDEDLNVENPLTENYEMIMRQNRCLIKA